MGRKDDPFYFLSRRNKFWDIASGVTGISRPSQVRETNRMWEQVQSKLARDQLITQFRMSEIPVTTTLEMLRDDLTDEERESAIQRLIDGQKQFLKDKLGPDGWAMYLAWKEEEENDEP